MDRRRKRFGDHHDAMVGAGQPLRRSASQVPAHAPPRHEPAPVVADKRPEPVASLPPLLKVTEIKPFSRTLPVMLIALLPALTKVPLAMRIG